MVWKYIFSCKLPVTVSLIIQKTLLWWRPTCLFLILLAIFLVLYPGNDGQDHCHKAFPLLISSFTVWGLAFKSWIHFELMFECGVRQGSNLTLLHVGILYSQHHLLKRHPFSILFSWHPFLKISWLYAFISQLYILGHWCGFELVSYYFNY